ncbi:site-specific DNA-methyltransferase [Heyndrickxia ginsengihumi]|uniref:site-specific DNA-methyltransferase n=1 Tax=Heyndrickxia ginsengihumi TaxID=363870 RepID=UPI003D1E4FB2
MTESYQKLIAILKEMFQLDQSDLDFGIYRIMNYKRNEIEKFLNEDLLPQVKSELEKYISVEQKGVEKELKELTEKLEDAGVALESSSKYVALKSKLDNGLNVASAENEVYSHLANFFRRYYSEGDFISLRRYKKDVYAMPYEGEEVKLHWANADQYYIKTAEHFRDYSFTTPDDKKVHFKLVDAETDRDNNKAQKGKERRFVITEDEPLVIENGELIIRFEYIVQEQKQKDLNSYSMELITKSINNDSEFKQFQSLLTVDPTEKNPNRKLIEKYLNDYTSRNTFDYFIHKDLGNFLKRELDFYIKNEIMFLDDIDIDNNLNFEQYLTKIKVMKKIAGKIISFLSQIEEFQKKLWLKKKFVTETNYCITLDRISENFYPQILSNQAQINEWKRLFAIDEITSDLSNLTEEFLKEHPYLIVDTKFFDEDFKEKIIDSIENLDEEINGVLIHSDNFHALNLLQKKYEEQIKCCYIDPPYNTNASKIIYKNGYEHSSWLSLIHDRVRLSKNLLSKNGIIEVAIDDYEFRRVNMLMDSVFGLNNFISNIAILTNPKGRDQEHIAQAHDYTIIYSKNKRFAETNYFALSDEEMSKKYSLGEGEDAYRELPLKRTGSGKWREDRPYMFFPFIYNLTNEKLQVLPEHEYVKLYNKEQDTFDDIFLQSLREKYESTNHVFILPIDGNGNYLRWRWGYSSCVDGVENGTLYAKLTRNGTYNIYEKNAGDKYVTPKSLWFGEKYDASSKGTNLLANILPDNPFDYPKSLYTVMDSITIGANKDSLIIDFFAGSGTTGHAVIELNREDKEEGKRKYILVEMGEYFETVTKPRIQKVIYSKDWNNGKPVSREGISQIFKYIRLESYEDTLNNLVINLTQEQLTLLEMNHEIREQYMLSYMLSNETENSTSLLNIDMFQNPFEYKMKIANGLETQVTAVDLVETFNYLLGIEVIRNERKERYDAIEDKSSNVPGAVKLSSSKDGEYVFKEIEGRTLDGDKILVIWRTLSDNIVKDNAALDAYFLKKKYSTQDFEFNRIYVNGDNNLQNLKLDEERWKVVLIEEEFKKLMFDVQDV